jgi:hypothetical protein
MHWTPDFYIIFSVRLSFEPGDYNAQIDLPIEYHIVMVDCTSIGDEFLEDGFLAMQGGQRNTISGNQYYTSISYGSLGWFYPLVLSPDI